LKVKVEFGLKILNDIFNPTFGFVYIWPKFWLKQQTWTYLRWTWTMTLFSSRSAVQLHYFPVITCKAALKQSAL